MAEKREIKLKITEEQFYSIFYFFNHSDWDFNECLLESEWLFDDQAESPDHVENTESQQVISVVDRETVCGSNSDEQHNDNKLDGARAEPAQALHDDVTCPHCYLSPCVTRHKQSWLGAGAAPHGRNSSNRKKKYRLFWNMLYNAGAWNHPQYIAKKQRALHRDRNDTTVWTVREIMPECVLNLVRSLYPNPLSQPYMGHKWY